MKAEANAKNYQLKRDKIRKKSNEYYRRMKAELSEAAALELKRKKAMYDSKRYNSKRDEINNKSKERYQEKKAVGKERTPVLLLPPISSIVHVENVSKKEICNV